MARLERMLPLLGVALGETIAGLIQAAFAPLFRVYPHVLALYPVMAAARGNIYASLGSRLSSRLHLGLVDARDPWGTVRRELPRVYVQSVLSALISATIAYMAVVAARGTLENPILVYGTALLAPLVLAPTLTVFTVHSAVRGFRAGLDPDEYLTPLVTMVSDIIVLPVIVASAITASAIGPASLIPLAVALLAATRLSREDVRVAVENTSAILAGSVIEFARSYILVYYLEMLTSKPYLLAILPTFNAENGAALGALSSRLATRLHLGLYEASLRHIASDAAAAYTSLIPAYTLAATIVSLVFTNPSLAPLLIALCVTAGLLVVTLMTLVAHLAAVTGFRAGLDPDNILVPIVTTLTDSLGTLTLVTIAASILAG